ncbi:MAG: vWA domain-containing protein [Pirellulaceae bacterium]
MYTQCPHCEQRLRLSRRNPGRRFLCPFCQRIFQLDTCLAARHVFFAALDISTSAERHFPQMLDFLRNVAMSSPVGPYSDISILLFHRQIVPFPCEQLGGLQPADTTMIPTLQDLHSRVGSGTAVLDVLHHMLENAEQLSGASCDIVILTDGEDRCSRRHPEELRYRIERAATDTVICLHVFTDGINSGSRLSLVRKLSVPRVLWSVHGNRKGTNAGRAAQPSLDCNHREGTRILSN